MNVRVAGVCTVKAQTHMYLHVCGCVCGCVYTMTYVWMFIHEYTYVNVCTRIHIHYTCVNVCKHHNDASRPQRAHWHSTGTHRRSSGGSGGIQPVDVMRLVFFFFKRGLGFTPAVPRVHGGVAQLSPVHGSKSKRKMSSRTRLLRKPTNGRATWTVRDKYSLFKSRRGGGG